MTPLKRMVSLIFVWLKSRSAPVDLVPSQPLRQESGSPQWPSSTKAKCWIQNYVTKINVNIWVISFRQATFLLNWRIARICERMGKKFKMRGNFIWTWYRKSKSTAEAKFVLDYHIFRSVTRFPIEKPKGGTFLLSCKPISLGRLLRGFHRNASTAQFYLFCERFKEKMRNSVMIRC